MVNLANPTLLVALPLFFAFLSIIIAPFIKKVIKFVPLLASLINLVIVYFIGVEVFGGNIVIGGTAGLSAPFSIVFVVDKFNYLILLLVNLLGAVISFYNIFYVKEEPTDRFHILFLLLIMSSTWISITGDLFNMFVAFEVLSASSFGLVGYLRNSDAIEAGFKYVVLGMLAGSLILLGVVLVYAQTGTLNMAHIASKLDTLSAYSKLIPFVLIFFGLAVEGALFPLNSWLPDAHPAAPSGVSAMLSGIVTTTAIYSIIRVIVTVFNYSAFIPYLYIIALLTLCFGEIAAFYQKDIKRMLAYSTIGQTGLFVLAFSVGTQASISASLAQIINHSFSKSLLFLVSGAFILQTNSREIESLKGMGYKMKIFSALFVVGSLSLVGLPPFFGFESKLNILLSIANGIDFIAIFSLVLVVFMSLVEAAYFFRVIKTLYTKSESTENIKENRGLLVPVVVLALILIVLSIFPGQIIDFAKSVASQLVSRGYYLQAVLGGGL